MKVITDYEFILIIVLFSLLTFQNVLLYIIYLTAYIAEPIQPLILGGLEI